MDINIHNKRIVIGVGLVLAVLFAYQLNNAPAPEKGRLVKIYREGNSFSAVFVQSDGDSVVIDGLTKREAVYLRTGIK